MFDPSPENSSFSLQTPGMQLAIDSTSLGLFKTCPFKYRLEIVEGWRMKNESEHLTFGILLHQAREGYEHSRMQGDSHDEALDKVLDFILKSTWDRELNRPWISQSPEKNRKTLVQTVVWYLDEKAQNDPLKTVRLSNGKPAVELSFKFDSGVKTSKGEAILLCGHLDRIAEMSGMFYIPDIKTSKSDVTKPSFSKQFTPHNQFSLYSIAGKLGFGFDISGVIVDGVQVGATFSRFNRFLVPRTESNLQEWLDDFRFYVRQMELYATTQHWPKNDTACDKYGGCVFRDVCAKSPSSREAWLSQDFKKRIWDPMIPRGE